MITKKTSVKYLNKDFDSLKYDLLNYAKSHYGDQIKDFSEASVGGMLLDLAAYIGDILCFYMDYQFKELFLDSAREESNIQKIMDQFGYKAAPPTPSSAIVTFTIEVPVDPNDQSIPNRDYLLTIKKGTIVQSNSGITFELQNDLNFLNYSSQNMSVGTITQNGQIGTYLLYMDGLCISGDSGVMTHSIGDFEKFIRVDLNQNDITSIVSVMDANGNEYFEVSNLSEDIIFESIPNVSPDSSEVQNILSLKHVPYRFVTYYDIKNKKTTLQFGSGIESYDEDDIILDSTKNYLSLYGRQAVNDTFFLDPININKFISNKTFGLAPYNTTLTIRYKYGGGLSHNVAANTITNITDQKVEFPVAVNATDSVRADVLGTITAINKSSARGGESRQTIEEIKNNIGNYYSSQNRIVTQEDYIARLYSMPTRFGRIFRVCALPSKDYNSVDLYILSRDSSGKLALAPESLKRNIQTYLKQYISITEKVKLYDSKIINLSLDFSVLTKNGYNKEEILQKILNELYKYFNIKNWQVGQHIFLSDVKNIIYNVNGVISVYDLQFHVMNDVINGNSYSSEPYNINIVKDVLICPENAIFEIKFPSIDIKGRAE